MIIEKNNSNFTFNGEIKIPTNSKLEFYSEKIDLELVHIELDNTIFAYYINDLTLNGEAFNTVEGFIISYYNLITN